MKKSQALITLFVLVIFNIFFNVFAETIILESGRIIEADIVDITSKSIKVNLMGAKRDYNLSDIRSIDGEKINTSTKGLFRKTVKTETSEVSEETVKTKEKNKPKIKQTEVEKIQALLKEKKKELSRKRKEYIQTKKDLKKAARSGFFGFGRSQEEVQKLIEAKKK
ncbi:MAG: hypothetical protein K9L61_00730, partial [Candidatus Omnitrophica bacterium]|nr:hypothetical protein [Candidatus Omnitrophota bacterium]